MSATSTNSSLILKDNLVLNNLLEPQFEQKVINNSFNFNSLLFMVNKVGGSPIEQKALKYNIANVGNLAISAVVAAAPTPSGLNLLVTVPSTDTRWRVKSIVRDNSTRVFGKVIAVNGAVLTIEPQDVALSSGTHFQLNTVMTFVGTASGNGTSTGVTSLSQTADVDYGVIAKWRETQNIEIQDRQMSFIKKGENGWYTTQQMFCLQRNAMAEEVKLTLGSNRLYNQTSNVEGDYNQFGSVRWTCVNNPTRSTYFPVTQEPTWAEIKQFFRSFKAKKAQMGQTVRKVSAYCGSNVIKVIQENITLTTQYTGQNSAFDMKNDSGFNVWIIPIEGLMVEVNQYGLFDNREMWGYNVSVTGQPAMESTMMLVDWSATPSVNGAGMTPTIQPSRFLDAKVKTMKPLVGMDVFDEFNTQGLAQSEVDTLSWQVINIKGYYVIPENVGWMELI